MKLKRTSLAVAAFALACSDTSGPFSKPFSAVITESQLVTSGGRCPALTATITGSGYAIRSDDFNITWSHCINPPDPDVTDGRFTFTFYRGGYFSLPEETGTLTGTYSGVLVPTQTANVFTIDGDAIFTGGTGQYAGATGTADMAGTLNVQTGVGSGLTLTGTITR